MPSSALLESIYCALRPLLIGRVIHAHVGQLIDVPGDELGTRTPLGHQTLALGASLLAVELLTHARQAELHDFEADSARTARWVSGREMHEPMSYDAYL